MAVACREHGKGEERVCARVCACTRVSLRMCACESVFELEARRAFLYAEGKELVQRQRLKIQDHGD